MPANFVCGADQSYNSFYRENSYFTWTRCLKKTESFTKNELWNKRNLGMESWEGVMGRSHGKEEILHGQ